MRDDVIHHSRGRQLPFRLTGNAQRMPPQIDYPRLAPFSIISPDSSAAAQPVAALRDVVFAVDLPLFAKSGTAGIAAGAFRFHGHFVTFFLKTQKNAWNFRACF